MDDNKGIEVVLRGLAESFDKDLYALTAEDIAAEWWWSWDPKASAERNTYLFLDILAAHRRRWRRWEEHHNGSVCVVERVRDKYIIPRVREFLDALRLAETARAEAAERGNARLREALDSLQRNEAAYRHMHDACGGSDARTGRAWDHLRRAGDIARAALRTAPGEEVGG